MTPAEYEWADEQTELAYKRRKIGKITFHRRMSALGYKTESIRERLRELDAEMALMDEERTEAK